MSGYPQVPVPVNEPVLTYGPGSPERDELKAELERQASEVVDIPLVIGGEEVRTGDTFDVVMPHAHGHVLARAHRAGKEEVGRAVQAAADAHHEWSTTRWEDRAAIMLKAADLLAGPWRAKINAATMLGQSKTAHQAEIDAACELIDFFRFNVRFASRLLSEQPQSGPGMWNLGFHLASCGAGQPPRQQGPRARGLVWSRRAGGRQDSATEQLGVTGQERISPHLFPLL